jgi:hypothetical protein
MGSRLVNVRLDPDRIRKARQLRARGVALSDIVRQAIDERFAATEPPSASDVPGLIRGIFEEFPDPPGLPERSYDVHNRRAARAAVLRKLRRP